MNATKISAPGRRTLLLAALTAPVLVAPAGCDRGPAMYRVRGHVFYTDGTVPRGAVAVVSFQPAGDTTAELRKSASGAIRPDGSFELWTRKEGDGVYEGQYDVTFNVLKAVMDPQPYIAEKYRVPGTYQVTVDRDIDNLKFEIEPLPGAPRGTAPSG